MTRHSLGRRLAALEGRRQADAGDLTDWSVFSVEERARIDAWCRDCGDRPLNEWAATLPIAEREAVRAVLVRIADQRHTHHAA